MPQYIFRSYNKSLLSAVRFDESLFIWVPGRVGIRGNSSADSAAKDALDGDISVELIPFSDPKPRTNKYILELWQSEWDEFPENNLYKIFPALKECIVCPRANRKEETVMARLHIGHSFITHSFLLKDEETPMCIGCDQHLTIEHILLTCSDFIEMIERATLQLNYYVCCFRIFRLIRFLTFGKKLIFLVMFVLFTF